MKTRLIYGSVEGQTAKIAHFVSDEITSLGHEVVLINSDEPTETRFENVDAVVLAACVHQRRHPRNFEAFLGAQKAELAQRKTLLLSVSLNAAFPEGLEEAREYVTEMEMRTGFQPDMDMLVPGAVRMAQYDYFATQVVRHVVTRDHPFDASKSVHEFTDWDALRAKIGEFLA